MNPQPNRRVFFDQARSGLLGPTLDHGEVSGCDLLLDTFAGWRLEDVAYGLATAYHETGHTMQPLTEFGGDRRAFRLYDIQGLNPRKARELGNLQPGDGAKYIGRGFPQTTGRNNYTRAQRELSKVGIQADLINHPELMLQPTIAAMTMKLAMENGWFTGKKNRDYAASDYVGRRAIINGRDKAGLIAGYARAFESYLRAAGAK